MTKINAVAGFCPATDMILPTLYRTEITFASGFYMPVF